MKNFNCTTPVTINKDHICRDREIANRAIRYHQHLEYHHICKPPKKYLVLQAVKRKSEVDTLKPKSAALKLYFKEEFKIFTVFNTYDLASMMAEIGGYVGIFLGFSAKDIVLLLRVFYFKR